jgi:hypothetical protein
MRAWRQDLNHQHATLVTQERKPGSSTQQPPGSCQGVTGEKSFHKENQLIEIDAFR